jgi:uroporphyrin-III C-methyltransferase
VQAAARYIAAWESTMAGRTYLVGAGPGDPDLLTVKAARLIRDADAIVFDRLVSPDILALIPAGTMRIDVGKQPAKHPVPQHEINELLVRLARSGQMVVRLKGGDPFTFGRGSEEAEYLARHGIPFEVVPGVTSASGCAARAGVPLTHRGLASGVRYVTGHCRDDADLDLNWRSLADPDTTLVVYMGMAQIARVARELMAAGLPSDTPVAAIASGTTPREARLFATLATIGGDARALAGQGPVLFIVGRVVALARVLTPGHEGCEGREWRESAHAAAE